MLSLGVHKVQKSTFWIDAALVTALEGKEMSLDILSKKEGFETFVFRSVVYFIAIQYRIKC